jgi:RNA polymerase primary sigma factor
MDRLDPDRQAELDAVLAAVEAAESSPPGDPVLMYLREIGLVDRVPPDRERELLAAVGRGDEAARYQLTESNLWDVVRIARSFIGLGVPFLDLVQEGNLGLIRAVSEVPFGPESFAERRDARVREAIEDAIRG